MKKIILLITVFCFIAFQVINAQTDKGRMLNGISSTVNLSGWGSDHLGLGFSSTKYVSSSGATSPATKTSFLNLIPKVGYFVIDNLAAGLDLTLSTYSTKNSDNSKSNGTLLCIGPFARYYIPMDKFSPFAEVNIGIGANNSKNKSSTGSTLSEHKSGVFLLGLWAGMAMPLGDMVTFDAMLGYNHVTYKTKATSGTQIKSLNLQSGDTKEKVGTFGVKMGFVVFFDIKK